jgi:hypothetical protein
MALNFSPEGCLGQVRVGSIAGNTIINGDRPFSYFCGPFSGEREIMTGFGNKVSFVVRAVM